MIKQAEEEREAERLAAIEAEKVRLAAEKEAAEKAAKEVAERKASIEAAKARREAEKQAAEKAAAEKAAKQQALLDKMRAAAEKAAAEEEAKRLAAEEAEKARLAAIEAAKTPEERAAEAAAEEAAAAADAPQEEASVAAPDAEAEAAGARYRAAFEQFDKDGSGFIELPEVEALLQSLPEPAPQDEAAALLAIVDTDEDGRVSWREFCNALLRASPPPPAAAPRAAREVPATAEGVLSLVEEVVERGGSVPFLVEYVEPELASALTQTLEQLEGGFRAPSAEEELRSPLLGFWKLLFTTSSSRAASGGTGCGKPPARTVLGSYQTFLSPPEGSETPSLQTVEVVADGEAGKALLAAAKGDYYLGTLASSGALGVVEDHTRVEYDGAARFEAQPPPCRWSAAFVGDTLRVSREENGALSVYAKTENGAVQEEIAKLLATPIAVEDEAGGQGVDDRPMWQKRLDEERRADDDRLESGIP